MRYRPANLPKLESSRTARAVGRNIESFAALDRIRKLVLKLIPDDLETLRQELDKPPKSHK